MKKGYWVVVYRSVPDEPAVKAYGALALRACRDTRPRLRNPGVRSPVLCR